jgi:DNA-binding LacI/PurR family transcriptional regulator
MYAQTAGLTTISASSEKLAQKGVQMLLSRISGETAGGGTVVLRPQIVERSSVKVIR